MHDEMHEDEMSFRNNHTEGSTVSIVLVFFSVLSERLLRTSASAVVRVV